MWYPVSRLIYAASGVYIVCDGSMGIRGGNGGGELPPPGSGYVRGTPLLKGRSATLSLAILRAQV